MFLFIWIRFFLPFLGIILIFTTNLEAQNLTLRDALLRARLNNVLLKIENYSIGISETDITTAKLKPNPVFNNQTLQLLNSAYYPVNSNFSNRVNRQTWYQLTKRFQIAGQRNYKIEFAQKEYELAQINYSETERNVFNEVASKWLDVWYMNRNYEIASEAASNMDSLVKINQIRLKNQVITGSDHLRTKILSEQYHVVKKKSEQNYLYELQNLQYLTGGEKVMGIDFNDPFLPAFFIENEDSLTGYALAHRPDVKAANKIYDAATSNVKLQKSLAYPQPEIGFIWNPQNTIPYAGTYFTLPLPAFDRNQGYVQKSLFIQKQAESGIFAANLKIKVEISSSFQYYQIQKENLERTEEIVQQSDSVLKTVQYVYLKGGTTIIDYLDAQRTWYDTQKMYFDALYTYRKSYLQLLFITGLINEVK